MSEDILTIRCRENGPLVLPAKFKIVDHLGKVHRPDLGDGDPLRAFEAEITEVARSVRSNQPSLILSGGLASDAITLCHKQSDSVQKGRPVRV